jgi:hypothetical protein
LSNLHRPLKPQALARLPEPVSIDLLCNEMMAARRFRQPEHSAGRDECGKINHYTLAQK